MHHVHVPGRCWARLAREIQARPSEAAEKLGKEVPAQEGGFCLAGCRDRGGAAGAGTGRASAPVMGSAFLILLVLCLVGIATRSVIVKHTDALMTPRAEGARVGEPLQSPFW